MNFFCVCVCIDNAKQLSIFSWEYVYVYLIDWWSVWHQNLRTGLFPRVCVRVCDNPCNIYQLDWLNAFPFAYRSISMGFYFLWERLNEKKREKNKVYFLFKWNWHNIRAKSRYVCVESAHAYANTLISLFIAHKFLSK